jgi:transposase-like protein
MSSKKQIPNARKVEILREHLENHRPVSEVAEQYGVIQIRSTSGKATVRGRP